MLKNNRTEASNQ